MAARRRTSAMAPIEEKREKIEEIHIEAIPLETRGTTSSGDEDTICEERPPKVIIDENGEEHFTAPAETAKDLVTEVIHVSDDPTLNPWTFRTWFVGIGLAGFAATLATIGYYKPQTVVVSTIFLAVISYVIGEFLAFIVPRSGICGRWLNPHSFNSKEHAAIIVMASAASSSPLAIEVLSTQRLFYNIQPSPGTGIFLVFASQCLGYGIAGLLRRTLVYPTKMLWPINLPMNTLIETLHGDKWLVKKKLRLFYIAFTVLFFYEIIPEYMMPILLGISVFCLSNRHSMVFTNIFGGTQGNEGMGFLSLSFDWQYIANPSPLWYPLQTLNNNFIGYILCIIVFCGVYYGNVWDAQKFPFLSQELYTANSTMKVPEKFNQTLILDDDWKVNPQKLAAQGLPYFTATFAVYIIATNLSITATFSHLMLWNYDDIKSAWAFLTLENMKSVLKPRTWTWYKPGKSTYWGGPDDKETDPHYKLMLAYDDAPNWWYGLILVFSIILGMILIYVTKSTLPWWGFLIACMLSSICILFFGAQFGITGFNYTMQPIVQMLGGYLHPGRPMANMYFVLFGYNSILQGQSLLKDLKFAQYAHLSPKCTFTMQMFGTFIGSVVSYVIMDTITTNKREILLDITGTNVWSGQAVQSFNSQAIAWGGLANHMFSVGQRYQWLTLSFLLGFVLPFPFWIGHKLLGPKWGLDYWNTAIIANFIGLLNVGVNSVTMSWFIVGWISQFYMRKYRPNWFIKYNYILSAAMDGGTQVIMFILSFAVFGGAGAEHKFPAYWGNNYQTGNYDYCMKAPWAEE